MSEKTITESGRANQITSKTPFVDNLLLSIIVGVIIGGSTNFIFRNDFLSNSYQPNFDNLFVIVFVLLIFLVTNIVPGSIIGAIVAILVSVLLRQRDIALRLFIIGILTVLAVIVRFQRFWATLRPKIRETFQSLH